MPIILMGAAAPAEAERALTVTARTRPGVTRSLQTWARTRREPVERELRLTARTLVPVEAPPPPPDPEPGDTPTEYLYGGPLLDTTSQVTGMPGEVLDWEYTHSGQHEELSVTVDGTQYGLMTPTATVKGEGWQEAADGARTLLDRLPARTFPHLGQEPEVDLKAGTTTFRFRNSLDQTLRGFRLPELIPWKLNPTPPGGCAERPRQRQRVGPFVIDTFQKYIDPYFRLETVGDPLQGAEWIEEERDFSTLDLTPQALWDQTYGLLGMGLHLRPQKQGIRLVGVWPQPMRPQPSPTVSDRWRESRSDRLERLHTPAALTVRSAPEVTELDFDTLMEWIGEDPAKEEIERALAPTAEWFEGPITAESGVVRRGFRKERGQLVAEVEITTGDVTAEETVDGEKVRRTFYGVLLGHTETRTTYDPECADRPLLQRTLSRTYGYTPFTHTSSVQIGGPGIHTAPQAGDLVASEEAVTTFRYSPQGWLTGKTTTTRKLGSLEQQGAEDEPAQRGQLQSREYLTSVTTESWMPTGSGRWRHSTTTSGQSLVPVYDVESGEAVRTSTVTRALPPVIEYTDQAPPSYSCPDGCLNRVLDETGVMLSSGDAGFGEEAEVSLPFLPGSSAAFVGRQMLTSQWWREVSTVTVPYPAGTPPGYGWGGEGGIIREIKIQGTAGGQVDSTVTVARLDTTFPPTASASGLRADPRRGSSVMLAGRPGGARVRLVTGTTPEGVPEIEDAFVAFRTGFPPTPGDQIEWELNPVTGQREANRAR